MHLELVALLRCPAAHAPSVLVASADEILNRYVTEGMLGCPECYAEYPVRGGITHFSEVTTPDEHARAATFLASATGADPMRLAAQLGLNAGRSVFALIGYDVTTMVAMRDIVPARMLLLDPPQLDATAFPTERLQDAALVAPTGVAIFGNVLPLVAGKFDGIAINSGHASTLLLQQSVEALRNGGRLVADVHAELPAGMRELVRDEHVWVAERESVATAPVGITRRL